MKAKTELQFSHLSNGMVEVKKKKVTPSDRRRAERRAARRAAFRAMVKEIGHVPGEYL